MFYDKDLSRAGLRQISPASAFRPVAILVGAVSILLSTCAYQQKSLTPTETAKEFERLYRKHDISRRELLTKRFQAEPMPAAADSGMPNAGGLAMVDSVFAGAAETTARSHGTMSFGDEKVTGNDAEVAYSLHGDSEFDLVYTLSFVKENESWKIDGVGASVTGHPKNVTVGASEQ